jgi:hypothetical protein
VHPATAVLFAFLIATAGSGADDPKPVTAAEAVKLVDRPVVVVEMTVRAAKDRVAKRGVVYLDSEDDFKSADNLGVAISAGAAAKLKAKGVDDPAAHFLGKTIRVRGCVMRFEERAYLPVLDPEQITVVEVKK